MQINESKINEKPIFACVSGLKGFMLTYQDLWR